jgi:hypothetical protein
VSSYCTGAGSVVGKERKIREGRKRGRKINKK